MRKSASRADSAKFWRQALPEKLEMQERMQARRCHAKLVQLIAQERAVENWQKTKVFDFRRIHSKQIDTQHQRILGKDRNIKYILKGVTNYGK